ncbi:SDR family oxidoreductase [Candidatus Woesearchaeota archaeon]|nr:SDR family oxidoreductase [Candidatus Woesearchaeota archaeon]
MDGLFSLKGKTAWITGGKRIGKIVAEVLAQHGANIVVSYNKSEKEAEETSGKLKKYGIETLAIKADVSSHEDAAKAAFEIRKKFKKIDILVLMASIFEHARLEKINEEDFIRNFRIHVLGAFWPIREAMEIMPKGSHIITIVENDLMAKMYDKYIPYFVTKGANYYLMRSLAFELGQKGIFINSIAPGPVLKPDHLKESEWKKLRKESAVNYPITDEEAVNEFAKLVLYLSTARSTGSVYPLDFGH